MTTLENGTSVTRKTKATIQHKPLVVTMHAEFLELRRFGKRESLTASTNPSIKLPRCVKLSATVAIDSLWNAGGADWQAPHESHVLLLLLGLCLRTALAE